MNIFKKLFGKKKAKNNEAENKNNECWYNDQAAEAAGFNPDVEGMAISSANALDAGVTNKISMS